MYILIYMCTYIYMYTYICISLYVCTQTHMRGIISMCICRHISYIYRPHIINGDVDKSGKTTKNYGNQDGSI